jgi:hypothetical protein
MAFTKALYYPRIEIEDETWLKTAALYWDEINTIVPASMPRPYHSRAAKELYEARVLSPLFVHPELPTINRLVDKVVDYLSSPALEEILRESGTVDEFSLLHPEKLPEIHRFSHIHPEKLPYAVQDRLNGLFGDTEGGWLRVHPAFADFYMTLLATELAKDTGSGLMTDVPSSDRLAAAVRLDYSPLGLSSFRDPEAARRRYRRDRFRRTVPGEAAQAILADLTFTRLSITEPTSVQDLLKFREDHKSELGRFRNKLAELTKTIDNDLPLEALQQRVADIYANEVAPAITELKESLSSSRIKWAVESFLKTSFLSVPTGGVLFNLGMNIAHALLASAGVSLTASIVMFNNERRQELASNPFSYVLGAEKELRKRKAGKTAL